MPFTDDREANGNLILIRHFEYREENESKMHKRLMASRRQAQSFQRLFGVSLGCYWNIVTGFDICSFDTDIVKSPDGESCKEAIQRQWGDAGLAIIVDLMQ